MYLVTIEDDEGMWLDDPQGFDTLPEAKKFFNALKVDADSYVIYECRQVDFRDASEGAEK